MEDVHRTVPNFQTNQLTDTYLGVYDGHGGRGIVDYIEERLEKNFISEVLNGNLEEKGSWIRPTDARMIAESNLE